MCLRLLQASTSLGQSADWAVLHGQYRAGLLTWSCAAGSDDIGLFQLLPYPRHGWQRGHGRRLRAPQHDRLRRGEPEHSQHDCRTRHCEFGFTYCRNRGGEKRNILGQDAVQSFSPSRTALPDDPRPLHSPIIAALYQWQTTERRLITRAGAGRKAARARPGTGAPRRPWHYQSEPLRSPSGRTS